MIKQVFKRPYLYVAILIFIAYLTINIVLSEFYITIQYIPRYLSTIRWQEFILAGVFSITISMLVAINSVLLYLKWKERIELKSALKKQSFITGLFAVGGLATGICPACITGLFPLLFAAFGTGLSFLALPWKGLEIQLLVIAVLLTNMYFLGKKH